MFSLTQCCTDKLLSWIEAEKDYKENALLHAYSFLEQFMIDHGLILSHDEIMHKIEHYLTSIDSKYRRHAGTINRRDEHQQTTYLQPAENAQKSPVITTQHYTFSSLASSYVIDAGIV